MSKRTLLFILILLSLPAIVSASPIRSSGAVYVEVTKQVNGGYIYGLPVLEWSILQRPLLIDIEFRNNFTSPRGNLQIPNHHSSQMELHIGQQWGSMFGTFSLGGIYHYAQNDDKLPEGLSFQNTLRLGAEF